MFKKINFYYLLPLLFLIIIVFITTFDITLAAEEIEFVKPDIQVNIGGFTASQFSSTPGQRDDGTYAINWIGSYVAAIYRYGIGLAAILATIMIMIGGFIWLTSAGSPDRVGKGKEFIISALTGLVLAFFSYMILYTINPNLVSLDSFGIAVLQPGEQVCCKQAGNDSDGNPIVNYELFQGPEGQACPPISAGWTPTSLTPEQCGQMQTQTCNPPNITVDKDDAEENCRTVCEGKNLNYLNVATIYDEDNNPLAGCCACDDQSCRVVNQGCSNDPQCCQGLICNRWWSDECFEPIRYGKYGCKVDNDCLGDLICSTMSYNMCCNKLGIGAVCDWDDQCRDDLVCSDCPWSWTERCTEPGEEDVQCKWKYFSNSGSADVKSEVCTGADGHEK